MTVELLSGGCFFLAKESVDRKIDPASRKK
jgi:hypothetical protein